MQPAYKVVQIQGISAYSARSLSPDSCICLGIGIGDSRLYGFSGYRGGPEPFHISGCNVVGKVRNKLMKSSPTQEDGVGTGARFDRLKNKDFGDVFRMKLRGVYSE